MMLATLAPELVIALQGALAIIEQYHEELTGKDDFAHAGISHLLERVRLVMNSEPS